MVWNINTLITLFTMLAYGVLFFVVFLVKPHTKDRQMFQFYLLTMFIWSLSAFLVFVSRSNYLFWFRLMMVSGFASVIAIFFFLQVTLNQHYRWSHWAIIYGLFTTIISLFTNAIVTDIVVENGVIINYQFTNFMPILLSPAYLLTFANYSLVWRAYRRTKSPQIQNRYRYLALGLLVILLGTFANYTPLGNYPIDIAANFLAALLFGYAIMKHKLLDITIVIRKGLFYFIPTTFISATYFLIITFALNTFHLYTGFQIFLLSLLVAIFTGLVIKPVHDKAQLFIDRFFFRDKYDFGLMLERISNSTATVLDIDKLLDIVLYEIINTLHIHNASFFQINEDSGEFNLVRSVGLKENINLTFRKTHPIVKWLEKNQQSLLTSDMNVMPQFKGLWKQEKQDLDKLGSEIFIPVQVSKKLVGFFVCGKKRSDQNYGKEDQRLLATMANQTAVSIQNARLYRKELDYHRELNSLFLLSQSLLESNEIKFITDQAAFHTIDIINATFVRLLILNEQNQFVCNSTAQIRDLNEDLQIGEIEPPEIVSFYRKNLQEHNPIYLNRDQLGMPIHIRNKVFRNHASSVILAAIEVNQELFGILIVGEVRDPYREKFNHEKIRLLNSIVNQVTSALNRAKLHEELELNFFETVLALANAVDARDEYTSDHSSKMVGLAVDTCDEMGLDEEMRTSVYWASILHDIGKIGIEDNILRKPGPLNEKEWELMRKHPEIGADIVKPIKKLKNVAPLIYSHHERYDGEGYPQGLAGEKILLGARILSVADAYEAMTSDRVYRKGRSSDEAILELKHCSGTQFDPEVVAAFLRSLEKKENSSVNSNTEK